jgi:hypothetical protein
MAFDYDVDELDDDAELSFTDTAEEFSDEYGDGELDFEDVDFESLGIDPKSPTAAKPGSEEKVLMLAARYAAGVPLWHNEDCYDHGPGELAARMMNQASVAQKN